MAYFWYMLQFLLYSFLKIHPGTSPISNKCKHVTVSLGFPFYNLQIDINGSWTSIVQIGCLITFNIGKLFLQSIHYYHSDLLWTLIGQFIMAPFSNEYKSMFLTQKELKRIELVALDTIKWCSEAEIQVHALCDCDWQSFLIWEKTINAVQWFSTIMQILAQQIQQ